MQLDLFSSVLADIQRIIIYPDTSTEFKSSKKRLDVDYYSKMMLLGNDSIVSLYTIMKDTINLYSLLADANNLLDTIKKHTSVINFVSKQKDAQFLKLSKEPKKFKDSTIRSRAGLVERTSIQWKIRKDFITAFINENVSLKDTLSNILSHLNVHVSAIKSETINDVITDSNMHTIDSLSQQLNRSLALDVKSMNVFEKNSREKIKSLYTSINGLIKRFNRYLSK